MKIFIENWPEQDFLALYIPIAIALAALGVAWYSAHLSRKSYRHSSRPYVWASSYGVIDQEHHCIIQEPQRVAYRVKNSPAKIKLSSVSIILDAVEIFNHKELDYVRFPDDSSESGFLIGKDQFNDILKKHSSSSSQLIRKVFVKYTSLNGGTVYEFYLKQEFIAEDNQWRDVESQAS
jgi:hypothetical protein